MPQGIDLLFLHKIFFPGDASRGGQSVTQQAMEAQRALLPYALCAFAVGLPIFVWAGSHAPNTGWIVLPLMAFAIAWGGFYGIVSWLREPQAQVLSTQVRVQLLGGLQWACAIAAITAFAEGAGPMRAPLLIMAAAAAVVCVFFTAAWLPSLAIVAPAAAAAPLAAATLGPPSPELAGLVWGAIALSFALALILNRALRRQFALAAERETLIAERARSEAESRRLAQSKSDLVATLSHEIRNGLAGVAHVLAAAAGRSGRQAPSREQLCAALDAANDLVAVLNTALDSETAETGGLSVDIHPFDAAGLARDIVLLNRPTAAGKGLEIALHVDPELAEGAARADPTRVRQILVNLIGNALKFTVRGRVEVRVILAEAGRLAIEVADTGPGLSPDELERAFEAFNRIERTSAGVPGAGLGLSLSLRLARLMGGELSAHSAVGVGSCFRLDLPFDPDARLAPLPTEASDAGSVAAPDERQTFRILIAEDDALNAAMLRSILEQLGHHVVHAIDGRRAVDLAKVCDFDLMMIDGRMPSLDGPAAMAEIRALPGPAGRTPIVAVICGDAEEAAECIQAGANVVLRKPVTVSAVARAVADARAPQADAARRQTA